MHRETSKAKKVPFFHIAWLDMYGSGDSNFIIQRAYHIKVK
jgi:hypothetical protein